jgi:hypothetical protein
MSLFIQFESMVIERLGVNQPGRHESGLFIALRRLGEK